jgi:hypothetical protein
LIEQMGSKDLHGIAMAIAAALFHAHARRDHGVLTDVYCDLTDAEGPSMRAPDVTLVQGLEPRNECYSGTPVLAVEVRGTQSKRYLEEKVKLYLEHDWPLVWILHVEQGVAEVFERGVASAAYAAGAELPLPWALQTHGLTSIAVEALFDRDVASRYLSEHALQRGKRLGLEEGRRVAAAAIVDLAEAYGLAVDEPRRTALAGLELPELEALRMRLKRDRQW